MARKPRSLSVTGYMHVIVRGIGRQVIFEDYMDNRKYLNLVERFCMETGVSISAYCLMENHAHLLVYGESEKISLFMKKLGVAYSGYFNRKYDRVGHLFQGRFKSEPVNNEVHLLNVFRYILQNPERAGICSTQKYKWSSYGNYDAPPDFMDLCLIQKLIGTKEKYEEFVAAPDCTGCNEHNKKTEIKRDDEWALGELKDCLGIVSGTELQNYDKKKRDNALSRLKARGLSVRQIERLTGVNRNIIQRVRSVPIDSVR